MTLWGIKFYSILCIPFYISFLIIKSLRGVCLAACLFHSSTWALIFKWHISGTTVMFFKLNVVSFYHLHPIFFIVRMKEIKVVSYKVPLKAAPLEVTSPSIWHSVPGTEVSSPSSLLNTSVIQPPKVPISVIVQLKTFVFMNKHTVRLSHCGWSVPIQHGLYCKHLGAKMRWTMAVQTAQPGLCVHQCSQYSLGSPTDCGDRNCRLSQSWHAL